MSHTTLEGRIDTNLRVRPPRTTNGFPNFQKPLAVGFFSVGGVREFIRSDANLRYFRMPDPRSFPLDLNAGISEAIKKPDAAANEALEHILRFLYDHHYRIFVRNSPPEFVAYRGLLRLVMCSPYEYKQDWNIHVTRFNDTIYMVKKETEEERHQRLNQTKQHNMFCAWGFKFEQYCLSDDPLKMPDPNPPVNECEEFNVVFATQLGPFRLLYGAEMDGILSDKPIELNYSSPVLTEPFVELKVREGNLAPYQLRSYLQFKTRNWWCQSFLVGIKDFYVGLRDKKGFVHEIEHVDIATLRKNGAQSFWTPGACVSFLQEFLTKVKTITANEDCPYTVYDFYFSSEAARISYKRLEGKTDASFIPDWYIELMRRIRQQKNIAK